jgi:hypothetical protein
MSLSQARKTGDVPNCNTQIVSVNTPRVAHSCISMWPFVQAAEARRKAALSACILRSANLLYHHTIASSPAGTVSMYESFLKCGCNHFCLRKRAFNLCGACHLRW